jgi:hypothetical protein
MFRRRFKTNGMRARFGNKFAIGIVMAIIAMFAFLMIDKPPYHPMSLWGPGWKCLSNDMTGAGNFCSKKNPATAG